MLERIWRYLAGYLEIALIGPRPERILNLAASERLELWHVRHRPDRLLARLRLADVRRARRLARRAGLRLRFARRTGLPFLWVRLRWRFGLLTGALLTAAALLYFAGHVWVVQVRGAEAVDARAVLRVAADLGLRPGAWRGGLEMTAVERGLTQRIPQLAWTGITLQGTRAVIQVVERHTVLPPQPVQRTDLVAERPCQIVRLVVLAGHAVVREGDVVRPGQLLIEGVEKVRENAVKAPGEPAPDPDIPLRDVQARGIVEARCWYQAYYELPRVKVTEQLTGQRSRQVIGRVLSRDILKIGRLAAYAHWRQSGWRLALPWWRNTRPIVEIQYVATAEVSVHEEAVAFDQLLAEAKERLAAVLAWRLAPRDKVEALMARMVQDRAHFAGIQVTAQVLEDIGRPASPQGNSGTTAGAES